MQFGVFESSALTFLLSPKTCLYRNVADIKHCSGVVLVLYSWIHLTYVDGHVPFSADKYLSIKKPTEGTHEELQNTVPRITLRGGQ